ncbi:hypothetical protein C8F01DRAFT_1097837 [Mycena amicta]|nr:hypothetical protein C8F01DRAFT_1097837 [Mycena amicta]
MHLNFQFLVVSTLLFIIITIADAAPLQSFIRYPGPAPGINPAAVAMAENTQIDVCWVSSLLRKLSVPRLGNLRVL